MTTSAPSAWLTPRYVRTTPLDLPQLDLLAALPRGPVTSWVRHGAGLVGWGEAARVEVPAANQFAAATAAWRSLRDAAVNIDDANPTPGLVAFGSFAFDPASAAGGVLIVPEIVLGRRGNQAWVTTVTTSPEPHPIHAELRDAASGQKPGPRYDVAGPGAVSYTPGALTPQAWSAAVSAAVGEITGGKLEKVVLARDVLAQTAQPIDARYVLRRLAAQYASCYTFAVAGLVGATPELLVRAEQGLVTSRVLAGTIRRTGDDSADLARAAQLSHSSKDLEEHEYAVASVAEALARYCSSMNLPETPFVLGLPNVLHLATDVTGVLTDRTVTSLDLAAAVQPSAAVCGTPTPLALETIRELEGWDRGRYAGAVGWIGADGDGEWGIALRSAQLEDAKPHTAQLFAGCGIVAASNPADELAETEAKLEPMRQALS